MSSDVVHIQHRRTEPLKDGVRIFKSAYDWELTEKDLEKAVRELGETEEKKRACLRKLKEKLSSDATFKYRHDDLYLLRYLRRKKYDVKKTYQNIKLFFEERKKHPEFFKLPVDLKSLLELNYVTILPYTNEEGSIIFWINFDRWNPSERNFEEMLQVTTAVCDIVVMNPHISINGSIGVWDMNGLSARHVSELLWNGRLWSVLSLSLNGYPWRIRKVLLLNTNRLVRFLYNLMKPLIQRKIAERNSLSNDVVFNNINGNTGCIVLSFYGKRKIPYGNLQAKVFFLDSDINELHQHVNPVLLPKKLHGNLEEEECDITQHVLDNIPYLRYERTFIFQ